MKDYRNVECRRCGNRWYCDKFEERNELPDYCPKCYRDEVQKIPDPPTKLDKLKERIQENRKEIPEKIAERKHRMILWKEQNKFLISLVTTGIIIMGLVSVMAYFLFF